MIKVENVETWGFEHAIRGMRNPMNSWEKSDSYKTYVEDEETLETADYEFFVGPNDLDLMRRLYTFSKNGNHAHRKYLRQIFVSMDITAPLYWWKEFDTYKVGTVANSCSTMHKIAAKRFEQDDFSTEHLTERSVDILFVTISCLNFYRELFLETKDKIYWWQMIQLLPSSYNQRRTVTMNYENVVSMILQRTGHKLDEWNSFVETLKTLPYVKEITED